MISRLYTIFGILLYFQGFFLTRKELSYKSDCQDPFSEANIASNWTITHPSICWMPRRFERVFFFIVDALRYDFVVESSSNDTSYNNFQYLHHLLKYSPSHSMLFGFRADPPTTTSQRLKGLLTGCLPTFFDISSNFNNNLNLNDDNIIQQLIDSYRVMDGNRVNATKRPRSIFLGDNTWMALFPNLFDINIPFDAFNTQDIHGVDDGIDSYLRMNHSLQNFMDIDYSAISPNSEGNSLFYPYSDDWKLAVAHYLGVDHVGHTYHAYHPLMKERLLRMNENLEYIVNRLPNDTLLVMFGDHGMTDDGNHGGATADETDSAIFFYSKAPLQPVREGNTVPYWNDTDGSMMWKSIDYIRSHPRMISQVDLVPTLSLLLGIPIPYSNLGRIIPELFLIDSSSSTTHESSCTQHDDELLRLSKAVKLNALQIIRYLHSYFGIPQTMHCHAKLSMIPYYCDIVKQINHKVDYQSMDTISISQFMQFMSAVLDYGRSMWTQYDLVSMTIGLLLITLGLLKEGIALSGHLYQLESRGSSLTELIIDISLIALIYCSTFLILKVACISFLLLWNRNEIVFIVSVLSTSMQLLIASLRTTINRFHVMNHSRNDLLESLCVVCLLVHSIGPFSDNMIKQEKYIVYGMLTTISLAIVFFFKLPLKHWLILGILIAIECIMVSDMSLLNVLKSSTFISKEFMISNRIHYLLPNHEKDIQLAFVVVISLLFWYWNHNQRLIVQKYSLLDINVLSSINILFGIVLVAVYWISIEHSSSDFIRLYIPRFVYTICLIGCVSLIIFQLNRHMIRWYLLGYTVILHGMVSSIQSLLTVTMALITYFIIVRCFTISDQRSIENRHKYGRMFTIVVLSSILSRCVFFQTNHDLQFSAVQLSAGFVGFDDFHFIIAGLLVAINTFAIDVIFLIATIISGSGFEDDYPSEKITRMYVAMKLVLVLCSAVSTYILRRHLMVWAVFAPKLVFETTFYIVLEFVAVFIR